MFVQLCFPFFLFDRNIFVFVTEQTSKHLAYLTGGKYHHFILALKYDKIQPIENNIVWYWCPNIVHSIFLSGMGKKFTDKLI